MRNKEDKKMKYKEFEEQVEVWGRKHGYATRVIFEDFNTYIEVGTGNDAFIVAHVSNIYMFTLETRWNYSTKITNHARGELFDILVDLAKTPPGDRKDEKRFIIPLPELVTTDGKQQYLTHKDCKFFASRRDETLRQTWKEEHLKFVPEVYRQFAVEFDEGKENK